ncbi:MAG: 3'-5' exonuclease [Anaerolineae bacterium]|nr:3'-5' exonuclease [Anaerolineae bacterium]
MTAWRFRRRKRRRPSAWHQNGARKWTGVTDWPQLLERDDVLILDTETTGLDRSAEVIEVALINTRGDTLLHRLALPQDGIPRSASRVHGLTLDVLQQLGAGSWTTLHDELAPVLAGAALVLVYNAAFDRRLLQQTSARHNQQLPSVIWRCAMNDYAAWHRLQRGARRGYGLEPAFRRECGDNIDQQHRALSDCRMVLALMRAVAAQV